MIFSIKDSLRQAVEAASGGLCTVMYTQKGQPVFLRRVPRFNLQDIHPNLGTGPHPAFVVGEREVSEIWVGMYQGVISQGELLSVPGVAPSTASYATMRDVARAGGPGFHLMTVAEWAAVALLAMRGFNLDDPVRGNTDYGRDRERTWETGVRVDGGAPGDRSGSAYTLTGSGPLTWRHDGTAFGIADLVGNVREWVAGVRFVNGQLQLSLNPFVENWQAVLPNGNLVSPSTQGTLHYTIPPNAQFNPDGTAANLGFPTVRTTSPTPPSGWGDETVEDYAGGAFAQIQVETGLQIPPILRALLLYPITTSAPSRGHVLVRPYGTRYVIRGGDASEFGLNHGLASFFTVPANVYGGLVAGRVAYVI